MTTLTLYKGVAFDGVNSFPHITTKSAFDSYLSGKQQYSQTINFNRIGEPILINESYDTAIGYSYGCINTGSKKYYIIPDSISVNENNRVHLTYSVDWFTTLEYADAVSFGRCHLIHSSDANPLFYDQSIQPSDMRITNVYPLDEKDVEYEGAFKTTDWNKEEKIHPFIVIAYMKNGGLNFYYSPLNTEKVVGEFTYNSLWLGDIVYSHFITKNFFEVMELAPQDVTGIWVSPIRPTIGTAVLKTYSLDKGRDGTALTPPYRKYYYSADYRTHDGRLREEWLKINNLNYLSTHMKRYFITDNMGNILYQLPIGRQLTSIAMKTINGFDTLSVAVYLGYDGEVIDNVSHLTVENSSFTFNAPSVPFVNDVYRNWSTGMKGVEIEERRIQKNKSLVSGIASAGLTGTIGGAPGRDTVRTPRGNLSRVTGGNPTGAVFGLAAGLAGPLLSYGLDTYYESTVNSIEDAKYRFMADTFVPGNYMPPVETSTLNIVEVTARPEDIARYNAEIAEYGVKCNLPVASWTPSEGAYKFADVEVIADVPYSIKENIKRKLTSGIKIVRLS